MYILCKTFDGNCSTPHTCVVVPRYTYVVFFDIVSDLCDAIVGPSCYFIVTEKFATFHYSECEYRGAQLAVVDNAAKNAVIAKIAQG